jgi:phage shock protein C
MNTTTQRLSRSSSDRMVAGVAGGIAKYFNVDPTLVRLAFVALALAGGPGVLLYIIMWIVMPVELSA